MKVDMRSTPLAIGALIIGVAGWGCGDAGGITGLDGPGDPIQLSREITLGELENALTLGPSRLEIEVYGESGVARRVELKGAEARQADEAIVSRVTGLEVSDLTAVATLMLGGVEFRFDSESRFRIGDQEAGFDGFIHRIEGALAEGFEPWIAGERHPPDQPQDPAVAGFRAGELWLSEVGEGHRIRINVDADNLELNPTPANEEPDGWIHILGARIELRVSDGVTELVTGDVDVTDHAEFEGQVSSVDLEARTFSFSDGTLVKISDQTLILETDFESQLLSLEAVHAALEAGHEVVAWGGGELESVEPRVILALELRFAIRGESGGTDLVDFEGHVTSVNFEHRSFTLGNGTIVRITDDTRFILEGDGETLTSLEAVQAALDAGHEVIAWGAGDLESEEPLTIVAREMRFVDRDAAPSFQAFEGHVASVQFEGDGSFVLVSGTQVRLTADTDIRQPEQGQGLMSLEEVHQALEAGQTVVAWGEGEVEGVEPLRIVAIHVVFVAAS